MKTGKIEIKWDKDDSGQDAVRLSVYDTIGELKISFDDTALQYYDSESENLIGHFTEMRDLLEAAVRVGRGEEQVLNSLLDELGDDVPF